MTAKVVLVTGSSGGIGAATARAFRDEGWYVVGMDIAADSSDSVDRFLNVDLTRDEAIQSAFEMLSGVGRLDALVNNAGASLSSPLSETSSTQWDEILALNLRAAFATTKRAVPLMSEHGGSIVNVSSVHAVATAKGVAAYAASKGGLIGLTRAAALELAPLRIRVNAVIPGAVDTEMLRRTHSAADLQSIAERTPLGRIGTASEIAQVVLFLADERRSSFTTGATVVADGGALARLSTE